MSATVVGTTPTSDARYTTSTDVTLDDPTFIPRLSFRHLPRTSTDQQELTQYLKAHGDHAIFVDTNITWLSDEWWSELLSVPGRVHLTARVVHELVPFLRRNPGHPLRAAIKEHHPGLILLPDPEDNNVFRAMDYYVTLLAYRRHLLGATIKNFASEHGRDPTREELHCLKNWFQSFAGERTLRLNLKPVSSGWTDEALVFLAVHHAVTTGQQTKIFSGDSDVEEQFYMMVRVLTSHYFGMLLAQSYVADFTVFKPRAIAPEAVEELRLIYEPRNATLIDLGDRQLKDFMPKLTTFVPVSCATIGKEYTSELTYGMETTMAEVFAIKAKTLGLSSDLLGGRNIHPYLAGSAFKRQGEHAALIARDASHVVTKTGMKIAPVDQMITTWPGDPHARVQRVLKSDTHATSVFVPPPGQRGVIPMAVTRTPRRNIGHMRSGVIVPTRRVA